MNQKKRRSYSRNFKTDAVKLMLEKGLSIAEASRRLGIEYSVLRRWKKQLEKSIFSSSKEHERLKPKDDELMRLKDKLARVTEERDILKKALAVMVEQK